MVTEADRAPTKEDAIKFLECAVRNWIHVPRLSADDIEDVRKELEMFAHHRTASTAALMGEVERLRAVVNEALIKQENDRTLWDAEWQIWAGDARDALSTPSEVREPEAIGGGEAEKVENRPRLLAMDHLNGIEEPIRGLDERGHPYLSYSGAHVIAAFVAGMQKQAALATPQPVSGDAVREALELVRGYGCPVCSGDCGSANPPVSGCPMQTIERALAALNHRGTQG